MFPLSDSPNPRGWPVVTLALMLANVAVFLLLLPLTMQPADPLDPRLPDYAAMLQDEAGDVAPAELARHISAYDLTVFDHGSRPSHLSLLDMLTSMFLHGGWLHLLGNMLFLWIYGNNCEARLGRGRFLIAYLAAGLAAALADAALRPGSGIPAVGASGAVSGVLGLYFVWFPRNKVRVLVMLPPFLIRTLELGARLVLGFYLVADNLLPVLLGAGRGGGVAHGAHIGGFLAGVLIALLVRRGGLREAVGTVDEELDKARQALDRRRPPATAYQHLARVLDADPAAAGRPDVTALAADVRHRSRTVPRLLDDR